MRVSEYVSCAGFPCEDVKSGCCAVPDIHLDPETVSIVMISEAAPVNAADHYYAGGESLFEKTTVQAFRDAGAAVSSSRKASGG
jgi:hypothetical protein